MYSSFLAFEYQHYKKVNFEKDMFVYEVAVPILAQATELWHEFIDYTTNVSISFKESVLVPIT